MKNIQVKNFFMTLLQPSDQPAFNSFKEFELAADRYIFDLFAKIPLRSVLSLYFFGVARLMCTEPAIEDSLPNREAGASIISRLGFLIPLLKACPVEPTGESAIDAMSVWDEEKIHLCQYLFSYAYLSEVAPYVHRGGYVSIVDSGHVTLRHPNEEFAEIEKRDIVLSQLLNPFNHAPPPIAADWFATNLEKFPNTDPIETFNVLATYYDYFQRFARHGSTVSDDCMRAAVGVSFDEYRKFACAALASAQFHVDVESAFAKRLREEPTFDSADVRDEMLEWVSPCYTKRLFRHELVKLSGLDSSVVDKLMTVYAAEFPKAENAGDGYFPPFVEFKDVVLFSPYVLQSMLSSRNVLYSAWRTNRKKFDEMVSKHMEPQLLAEAIAEFEKLPGV